MAARSHAGPQTSAYNPESPVEFGAAGFDVDVAWLDGTVIAATSNRFSRARRRVYAARILQQAARTSIGCRCASHTIGDPMSSSDTGIWIIFLNISLTCRLRGLNFAVRSAGH